MRLLQGFYKGLFVARVKRRGVNNETRVLQLLQGVARVLRELHRAWYKGQPKLMGFRGS